MRFLVTPEFRLPKSGETLKWTEANAAYIFWGIKRQTDSDGVYNCKIEHQNVTLVAVANDKGAVKENISRTFTTSVPVIVNTRSINADSEVIVQWHDLKKPVPAPKKKLRTWVEAVSQSEKKIRTERAQLNPR